MMAVPQDTLEWLLQRSSVRIRDVPGVKLKLQTLLSGGKDRLQIITDFDYTLSRSHDPVGTRCASMHGVFEKETFHFDREIGKQLQEMSKKYMAIEFDPALSNEEKTPHMLTWWTESHNLIVKCGFNRSKIEQVVKLAEDDKLIMLREDCERFLPLAEAMGVPLVLFSAGLGDLIEIYLRSQIGRCPANIHIISNMMDFDDHGNVIGFKEPLIHTFNKNSSVVKGESEFFHRLSGRDNVLLMGDSIGDLKMDVGVEHETVILKIGFLNFNVPQLMDSYLAGFDIVLVEDQTMAVPIELLSRIQNGAALN